MGTVRYNTLKHYNEAHFLGLILNLLNSKFLKVCAGLQAYKTGKKTGQNLTKYKLFNNYILLNLKHRVP